MKQNLNRGPSGLSRRLHFPDDEQRHPWLPALLDAFAIIDTGVAIAIRIAEKKEKKKLACTAGCDVCCHQTDIPLYPHELPGLSWYVAEKLPTGTRTQVREQCADHRAGSACPFLIGHRCAVHPVRPVACRQYNVFTMPCLPNEDPFHTRRSDVLVPIVDYTDRAFAAVASFYDRGTDRDQDRIVRYIKGKIMNLQEQDWKAWGNGLQFMT